MRHRFILIAVCAAALMAPAARAQTPKRALEQGITAYQELEMESAGWLLRQALTGNKLDGAQRVTALGYLGAAEFYRDRRDSALSAFGQLIRLEPHHRLDMLVFGPDVQAVFADARRLNPVVDVSAARTSFPPGAPGLPVHLRTNTPHVVVVTAETTNGTVLDTVFRDRVRDTATVHWTARGRQGARAPVGGFVIGVSSLDGRGRVHRRVVLPVHVTRSPEDPLTAPTPPTLLPEREPWGPGIARLVLGLGAATAAYYLTPEVTDSKGLQLFLTQGFVAAGVIGFWAARPGRGLPDNVVANRVAQEAYEARLSQVRNENQRRAEGGTVYVDVGRVTGF
ncbi:MAG TPA: hypothetical protein VGA02_02400 [Gemmatimonadales bacterium]|jgi:hypothetical protein